MVRRPRASSGRGSPWPLAMAMAVSLTLSSWAVGCGDYGPAQPANFELFTRPANTIGLQLTEVSAWNEEVVEVGDGEGKVPVQFRWRSGFDERQCERVEEVQERRTGGPENIIVEVSPPRGTNQGCNTTGGQTPGAFETMTLSVSWKRGDAAGTSSVSLRGNGTLAPS